VIAWLLGCAVATAPDAELMAGALHAATVAEGLATCAQMSTENARGDCSIPVLERHGALSGAQCDRIEAPIWRDECHFLLAEQEILGGEVVGALARCGQTRFARNCGWHLVRTSVQASLDEAPDTLEPRLAPFRTAAALPDGERLFWFIRLMEHMGRGVAIDPATCGGIPSAAACLEGAERAIHDLLGTAARRDPKGFCAAEPGTRVRQRGELPWVDSAETRATEARFVALRCAISRPGGPGSPHSGGGP